MNALLTAQALLGEALQAHPRLALAHAAAWLDPLHFPSDGAASEWNYAGFDERDDVRTALTVCRDLFPEVYCGASQRLWQGADERTLEAYLCAGINGHLVMKLDSLEGIGYGLPVEMLGLSYHEEEFFESYPDLAEVLADFGITQNDSPDDEDVCRAARLLMVSLEKQPGTTYSDLRWLLAWLFALSGNTCIDLTTEEFWEAGIEPLDWLPENLDFMNEMASEALTLVEAAQRGLQALQTDTCLRQTFRQHIHCLLAPVKPGRKKDTHDRLRWPDRP